MESKHDRCKTVVVGAGPVGALAARYAAQRGHDVEIYELRNDLRNPSTTPLNFTKSINLALSERGINAMREAGRPHLAKILSRTLPMIGRMIHGKNVDGSLYEQAQSYDIHGRTIFAVDRGELNKALLDELEEMPNVQFNFDHKLAGADFKRRKAWFIRKSQKSFEQTEEEIEIDFDFLIGADGAHSAVRHHLMKFQRINYQQEYIDTLWCEFQITPATDGFTKVRKSMFRISPEHLHIWPGEDFMFIAIPSLDGSFTCTLFMPSTHFSELEEDSDKIPNFFDAHFPGVTSLIPPDALISSFMSNPHLPLISIKCHPHHYYSTAVIIGDAAHAMVPFFGQGMNAGLEDVRVLFSILDAHTTSLQDQTQAVHQRAEALKAYSTFRTPDAHAINDLALENYMEMRASVISPVYKFRKWLEETLSVYVPSLGWQTKYSRVSFGNERYSEVIRKTDRQSRLLMVGLMGLASSPAIVGGIIFWNKWRKRKG